MDTSPAPDQTSANFSSPSSSTATLGIQRLGRLERAYLGALGLDPSAPTLYEALAEDPAFFVGATSAIYKAPSARPRN